MRIIVTGHQGFIGSALMELLSQHGHETFGMDIKSGMDIRDLGMVHRFFQKVCEGGQIDMVINLGALPGVRYSLQHPVEVYKTNVLGFQNVMDMCVEHGVKNLLYASSSSVYGDRNDGCPFKETDPVDSQMSPYAVSKRTNELMARNYHNIYGLNTMGLRFFTVYGPNNRRDMAMWKFTDAIYHGKEIELYNNGRCIRDFTYIDDITNGMLSIINQTEKWDNGAVNIGGGNIIMVGELPYIISEFLGKEAIIKYIGAQQGDVGVTHASVDKISQVFGYTPRWNLRDGVKNQVEWYLSTQR